MSAAHSRPVYLIDIAILNAAGSACGDLYGAPPVAQPLPFDPARLAHCIAAPRLPADLFDRKIQRSVEPQGLRLLHCVARLAPTLAALHVRPERTALTAAIPEVDAPSPCWEAVEAIEQQPDKLLGQLFANTPPLHALTLLNSSVMAYVAEALQCNGPMGGYCSQANAGVDALIEAILQIAENRADAALVVSSSPNITPALYLREPEADPSGSAADIYGEGAAALVLSAVPLASAPLSVRIAGFGRGYCGSGERAAAVAERVLKQALSHEKLSLSDIDLVMANDRDPLLVSLLLGQSRPLRSSRQMTGDLGASALLTEIAYATCNERHCDDPQPRTALLMTRSRAGHFGALLLVVENMEKGA